ncbi:MAG: GntR family transcriptional regulator [Arachnia sp.]
MKKYELIVAALGEIIDNSEPGDRLPTERALSQRYGVSAMTVRRALQFLSDGGRIHAVQGRGTFVAQPTVTKTMTNQSFSQTMRAQGRVPSARLLSAAIEAAESSERSALGLAEGQYVLRVNRLRLGDGTPLAIERASFVAAQFPELLGSDLTGSLYETLRDKYATVVTRASFRVRARTPDSEEAELLQISQRTPCLEAHALGRNDSGVMVESTRSLYRGDLYELGVEFE